MTDLRDSQSHIPPTVRTNRRSSRFLAVISVLSIVAFAIPHHAYATTPSRIAELNPHVKNEAIPSFDLKLMALAESPFTFFRGTCDLYAEWFKTNCSDWCEPNRPIVRLHGDVHPGNTGTYDVAENKLDFGLVDMDETFEGSFEYDALRAIVSLRFTANQREIELTNAEWQSVCDEFVSAYRAAVESPDTDKSRLSKNKIVRKMFEKASDESLEVYVRQFVTFEGSTPRFKSARIDEGEIDDVMFPIAESVRADIIRSFAEAVSRIDGSDLGDLFESKDVASQIIDVVQWIRIGSSGSQGLRKYLLLTKPAKAKRFGYKIFQMKEEPAPAAVRVGMSKPFSGANRAKEVADSYRILQHPSRRYISHSQLGDTGFLIKPKIHNGKEPKAKNFKKKKDIIEFAGVFGALLGNAHAGDRISRENLDTLTLTAKNETLATSLQQRSQSCFEHFLGEFDSFEQDSVTKSAVENARRWINKNAARQAID